MKVKELMDKLNNFPKDYEVIVNDINGSGIIESVEQDFDDSGEKDAIFINCKVDFESLKMNFNKEGMKIEKEEKE